MDPFDFRFVNTLRPPCSRCGRPLVLARIEPDKPGFDRRIYYCAHCQLPECIITRV
jgi:formamidopyrimidine-DNA glycosylase